MRVAVADVEESGNFSSGAIFRQGAICGGSLPFSHFWQCSGANLGCDSANISGFIAVRVWCSFLLVRRCLWVGLSKTRPFGTSAWRLGTAILGSAQFCKALRTSNSKHYTWLQNSH